MIAMGRLAFELQQGEAEEATDPLDAGVPAFDFPVLVAAGEYDLPTSARARWPPRCARRWS